MLCAFAINQAISAAVAEVRPCRAVPGVLVLAPLWPGLPLSLRPRDYGQRGRGRVVDGASSDPAAVYAGAGQLNIALVVLIGFLAAVAGDNIGFVIGHVGGRSLILHFGRYVLLTEDGSPRPKASSPDTAARSSPSPARRSAALSPRSQSTMSIRQSAPSTSMPSTSAASASAAAGTHGSAQAHGTRSHSGPLPDGWGQSPDGVLEPPVDRQPHGELTGTARVEAGHVNTIRGRWG
jgi:hypothetical protein